MNIERPRACAAIIKADSILMVREIEEGREFWTLPGGGLELGETFEQAAIREVREEVNLEVEVVKYLFSLRYEEGPENCYLVQIIDETAEPTLGYDPELAKELQVLKEVRWHTLESMKEDHQVSQVIKALAQYK